MLSLVWVETACAEPSAVDTTVRATKSQQAVTQLFPLAPPSSVEATSSTSVPSQPLSYYLEHALQGAEVMLERHAAEQRAAWQKYRAKWAWTPKLQSETGFTVVPADPPNKDIRDNLAASRNLDLGPVFSQSLSLLFPIYTFGRISNANKLADLGIQREELQTRIEKSEVQFQVQRAYAGLQLHAELARILTQGQELINEVLTKMQDARDFGDSSFDINDYRELQIFSAEVDSRVLDLQRMLSIAEDGMSYFTKLSAPYSVESFEQAPPQALPSQEVVLELAQVNRPQVLLLDKALEARQLQRSLAIANFLPNLVFVAQMRYVVSTENPSLQRICKRSAPELPCIDDPQLWAHPADNNLNLLSFGIGLGLRWDFDFPQQYGKLKEADADLEITQAQRRRALGAIELELKKLWQEADVLRQKVSIEKRRRKAAEQWRDQVGFVHSQVGGDLKKAIAPLKAYFEASARYYQAEFDYRIAQAALAKAVGITSFVLEQNSASVN